MAFRYIIAIALFGFLSLAPQQGSFLQYTLIFNDEFDNGFAAALDKAKWNVLDKPSEVNGELQYYSKDDVFVTRGSMHIRSQKRLLNGRPYTSGMVDTKDKFSFLYGDVEWRAKLPAGKGMWPALWLVHYTCQASTPCAIWPPEVDVIEARGDITNKVTHAVHYGRWPNNAYSTNAYFGPDFTADYHTFKVIWDVNQVTFFVDGQQTYSITDKAQIPNEPMHLIMNVAVGGFYPGNPDDTTTFPTYMSIDYVRVYRWQ